jgi:Mg-chelatase subunit ChlD
MNDKLVKTTNGISVVKKTGLAAQIANAALAQTEDAGTRPNRIGIVFDDSGSMGGNPIEQAHKAIDAFVKNCNAYDTALALYPLNAGPKKLTTSMADIALYGISIRATGGTPLFEKLGELIDNENLTRAVAFSDGQPVMNTPEYRQKLFGKFREKKVPIDTIFIGDAGDSGARVMAEIAEATGGVYLHFTDVSILAKSFKYLTPAYRAMLTSGEFRKKLERGEV